MEDMSEVMRENLSAVDEAIKAHNNRPSIEIPQLSAESRALMQQILASNSSQDEISSRVAALLAGTALSTSRGDKNPNLRDEVKMEQYDVGNVDLSARKRTDDFEMPNIPDIEIDVGNVDLSARKRTDDFEK